MGVYNIWSWCIWSNAHSYKHECINVMYEKDFNRGGQAFVCTMTSIDCPPRYPNLSYVLNLFNWQTKVPMPLVDSNCKHVKSFRNPLSKTLCHNRLEVLCWKIQTVNWLFLGNPFSMSIYHICNNTTNARRGMYWTTFRNSRRNYWNPRVLT